MPSIAVLVTVLIVLATGVCDAGSVQLSVASTLRDALLAVQRAAATNPVAAQNATFTYNVAMEEYNAHQYERARQSALLAISQSAAPPAFAAPVTRAPLAAPPFPGPRYYVIPDEVPATSANARKYVALAQRAMNDCAAPKTAAEEYRKAVSELDAKHYRVAMAASRNIVDDCTIR